MKVVLVLIVVGLAVASGAPLPEDIAKIISQIPEEDRLKFVKYYSRVGYDTLKVKETIFDDRNLPEDFAVSLYKYEVQHHTVRDPKILKMMRGIICFDDGTCIDGGDIGVHPL